MSLPVARVPDANYSFRGLGWQVYWSEMIAIDGKGRRWNIKEDGDKLYLEFADMFHATISEESIRTQYNNYKLLNKWVGSNFK